MTKTVDAARGKWRGILLQLGVPTEALRDKHGPCPICGGKDRYRFDNKDGSGSFFCSQCGAGDGFELLRRLKGWDFARSAREIDAIVGNVKVERVKPRLDGGSARRMSSELWGKGAAVHAGDPVGLYHAHRGISLPDPEVIRFTAQCPVPHEAGSRMAMLLKVSGPDGRGITVHRTFLTPQGRKADLEQPRALMPGELPDGAAIRLGAYGDILGIAEGYETARKASARFGIPVWAAVNSTMLKRWVAPDGVREVVIFGDNDPKFGGQAATFALAHRLAVDRRGLVVRTEIPGFHVDPAFTGQDWADAA